MHGSRIFVLVLVLVYMHTPTYKRATSICPRTQHTGTISREPTSFLDSSSTRVQDTHEEAYVLDFKKFRPPRKLQV